LARIARLRVLAVIFTLGMTLDSRNTLALDLTAGSAASEDCAGAIPRFKAAASAYLEPAPIASVTDYGKGHYTPSSGTNIGMGVGFAELSAGLGSYCLGVVYRQELEARATRDMLDILVDNHNGKTFTSGRNYQLAYELNMLSATGLRLRRTFLIHETRSWRVTLGGGVSLLKGMQGRDESFSGAVTATSPNYAIGTATWSRIDSNLSLSSFNPFVGAGHVSGLGFSEDFDLRAQWREGTSFEFIVMDAFGRMYWRDIRSAAWTLNNSSIRYDSNFNRDAFVTGFDSRINHVQDLPTKYRIVLAQPLIGSWSALLSDDRIQGYHFPEAGLRYGSNERYVTGSFDIRTKAVGVSGHWQGIGCSITTNRIRVAEATALGASLELNYRW
jgi:hypothetical protein